MPFNQLQSPENIIKAEVLLVALVKGLGLDAAGKPPLPTGHTISLQVGQLLCSAVWDGSTRVWRTSSILYHGSGSLGAGLGADQSRPLLCLLEPPELRVTCPAPGSEAGNCASVATLKLLLQHVPLLAFVEQGGVPAGLPSNIAATALQQQQQQQSGSAIDPSQGTSSSRSIPGSSNDMAGTAAGREGSTGSSSSAQSGLPVPGSEGSPDPSRSGQPSTAATGKEAAGQWRLRMSYAGRELPSAVINNVAFVTEDHFPVQVLVVELEVNLHPLCYLVVPGGYAQQAINSMAQHTDAAGRFQSPDQLTVMLNLELLNQEVPVAQLRLPAVVTGLSRDGLTQSRGRANTVFAGGGSGSGGGFQQADGRYNSSANTQFAPDGQHQRRRLLGQQMPFPVLEHVSQHSAGSSTTHQSYVTVASNPSDALPSPVHAPEFTSTRSSAPATVKYNNAQEAAAGNTQQNVQHGLILLQSISTRDDASSAMNSRTTMASAAVQSGTMAVPQPPMYAQPWPMEEGARPVGERQEEAPYEYFEEVEAETRKASAVQQGMPGAVQKAVPAAVQQLEPAGRQSSQTLSLKAHHQFGALQQSRSSVDQQASELHLDEPPTAHHNATQYLSAAGPDLAINAHQLMLGSASPNHSPDLTPLTDASSTSSSPSPNLVDPNHSPDLVDHSNSTNLVDHLHPDHCGNSICAPAQAGDEVRVVSVPESPRGDGQRRAVYRPKHERPGPSNLGKSMQRAHSIDNTGNVPGKDSLNSRPTGVEAEAAEEMAIGAEALRSGTQPGVWADSQATEVMDQTVLVASTAAEADVAARRASGVQPDLAPQRLERPAPLVSPFASVLVFSHSTADTTALGTVVYPSPHQESRMQEQPQHKESEQHSEQHSTPRDHQPQHLRVQQLSQSPSKGGGQRHGSSVLESGDICSEYLSATSSLAGR